jgi:hypothetical protein
LKKDEVELKKKIKRLELEEALIELAIHKYTKLIDWNSGEYIFALARIEAVEKRLNVIDRELRLLREPVFRDHDKIGDLMPFGEFVSICKDRGFLNSDGFGQYATKSKISDIDIYPSDIYKYNKYRKDFKYVVWYNK